MRLGYHLAVVTVSSGLLAGTTATAARAQDDGPAGVRAGSAYLLDNASGKAQWSRQIDTKRPIASITKVMTALVVLQNGNLDRKITIQRKHIDYAKKHDGTTASLRAGDRLTVRQLLYGLMLPSGCDAAYALADSYSGGWRAFVSKMNKTAAKLGMSKTHFANYDGLPWPSATAGYSTARDVLKLARSAMKYDTFRSIVAVKSYHLPGAAGRHAYTWKNTNRLLGTYAGAAGIKTGYTDAAGYCLLFMAQRGKRTLIGVVLNSSKSDPDARFSDAARLLDWGFGGSRTELRLRPLPPGTPTD